MSDSRIVCVFSVNVPLMHINLHKKKADARKCIPAIVVFVQIISASICFFMRQPYRLCIQMLSLHDCIYCIYKCCLLFSRLYSFCIQMLSFLYTTVWYFTPYSSCNAFCTCAKVRNGIVPHPICFGYTRLSSLSSINTHSSGFR